MTAVLVRTTVAPLLGGPSLQSEQVSQLVLGEGARVLQVHGDMLHVQTMLDDYTGWLAAGYTFELPDADAEAWLDDAAWSAGALLEDAHGVAIRAPHRARLRIDDEDTIRLPTGEIAELVTGSVLSRDTMAEEARALNPAEWAWNEFAGTPYLWGGVTGAGIDCSGLAQNTFIARGVMLPRDAHQQAAIGHVVAPGERAPGDLLFFRSRDRDHIGHVGILGAENTLVHSTIDVGGVIRESLDPGSRAHALLDRLVAVRRID